MNPNDPLHAILAAFGEFVAVSPDQLRELVQNQQQELEKLQRESSRTPLAGDEVDHYLTSVVQTCYPNPISFSQ